MKSCIKRLVSFYNKFKDSEVINSVKTKCNLGTNETQVTNKTIIPWHNTHTIYKNKNYKEFFGKNSVRRVRGNIVLSANPKNLQQDDQLIHPNQNRVTCRQFARLQVFPGTRCEDLPTKFKCKSETPCLSQ